MCPCVWLILMISKILAFKVTERSWVFFASCGADRTLALGSDLCMMQATNDIRDTVFVNAIIIFLVSS